MLFKRFAIGIQSQYLQKSLRSWHSRVAMQSVKVQVKQGIVVGQQLRLSNGVPYNSFLGVPYAVPPIGELRFRSPLPLERFSEPELDCTKERDVCLHRDPYAQEAIGSEDCLFLNIYVPQGVRQGALPVMVWIHGGGFTFGHGNSSSYFPQSLMEEGVVVVTLNYRLGVFGFLYLPEEGIWGNAGLKDQRLALQWIQENISNFNGDAKNVTLFGESAGAASVHLHTYARHANTLFHKAIMQSGTANMEWVFQTNPAHKTRRLANLLGFKESNTHEMLAFLQSSQLSGATLIANSVSVLTPDERRRGLPFPFKPIVEDAASPDSFITKPILEVMGEYDRVAMPLMMGYNSAEGIAMVVNMIRKLAEYEKDLARLVPRNIPLNDVETQILAQKMRDFYLNGHPLSMELLNSLVELLSDYHFVVDVQIAAEHYARHEPRSPLYFYRFDYVGNRNNFKRLLQSEHLKGACHGDELFYLFQTYGEESAWDVEDALIKKRMSRLWANFARHNNPTPFGTESDLIDCAWLPVQRPKGVNDGFVLDYLDINRVCRMGCDPDKRRIDFWRSVYSTYPVEDISRIRSKL